MAWVRPEKPYVVYMVYGASDRLLYVGVTKDFAARLNGHRRSKWFPLMKVIRFERYLSASEAGAREHSLIGRLKPPYNKVPGVYWDGQPDYAAVQPAQYPAFVEEVAP